MSHKLSLTLSQVLQILNDGQIHTGIDIGNTLGISRTAVWKIIKRLQKYGVEIQSRHQGYSLECPLILLDQQAIELFLPNRNITLDIFETLASTSTYLKNKTAVQEGTICLAEHQTQGKGRLGRKWLSPFGRNIYSSLFCVFQKDISEMSGLSLVVGVLIAKALESLNPQLNLQVKWPNDLYINNQKLGGILIDLTAEAHGNCQAVISMGLNVNMKGVRLANVDQPWISLEHVLHEKLDRNKVVGHIFQTLLEGLDIFRRKGLEVFLAEWEKYDYLKNQKVSLNIGSEKIIGVARGIDTQGFLLVENDLGPIQKFSYGDAQLFRD